MVLGPVLFRNFISALYGGVNVTLMKFSDYMKSECVANIIVDKEITRQREVRIIGRE